MLFNSLPFLFFLPIVFSIYWLLPHKYRWILLLISSYYFYMSWNVKYIFLILFTTAISYFCAIFIENSNVKRKKKILLTTTLIASLGILFFFKYFNFFNGVIIDILNQFAIELSPHVLQITLPVGISFYTFQTLSYVIDVYRGNVKAEKHFGKYATFISFFPQLVAGPIERSSNLLPQIDSRKTFSYNSATYGLKLMAWGFFKKIVIADTLAPYVNSVYNNIHNFKGFPLMLATIFFTFQIYCDFSGYSDIAIGTSKLFGINLMTNFKSPYFSKSIKEFWSRWHISLSTWFRDYIYIPLGGNRVKKTRHIFNLIITFMISGLWHGANYTFLLWGAIHGLLQTVETFLYKKASPQDKTNSFNVKAILSLLLTFAMCCLTWVFFRANNISEAIYVFKYMGQNILSPIDYLESGLSLMGISKTDLILITIELFILLLYDFKALNTNVIENISKMSLAKRWFVYISFVLLILALLPASNSMEFIYFQF